MQMYSAPVHCVDYVLNKVTNQAMNLYVFFLLCWGVFCGFLQTPSSDLFHSATLYHLELKNDITELCLMNPKLNHEFY